jgi:hypothetical protein
MFFDSVQSPLVMQAVSSGGAVLAGIQSSQEHASALSHLSLISGRLSAKSEFLHFGAHPSFQ